MAVGTFTFFDEFKGILGDKLIDLDDDVIKCMVIHTTTPTAADATPTYSDYSANECPTGGNYVTGGTDIVAAWSEASGTATLTTGANPTWAPHASHTTAAIYAIIYSETSTLKHAIGFIELGTVNMVTTTLTITFGADLFDLV